MRIERTTLGSCNDIEGPSYRDLSPDTDVDTNTPTWSSDEEEQEVEMSLDHVSGILDRPGASHPLLIITPERIIRKRKRWTPKTSSPLHNTKQPRGRRRSTSPLRSSQPSRSTVDLDSDSDAYLTDCLEVYFSTVRSQRLAQLPLSQDDPMESQHDDMPFTPTPLLPVTQTRSLLSFTASRSITRRMQHPSRPLHPALIHARRMQERRAREREKFLAENPDAEHYETDPDVIDLLESSEGDSDSATTIGSPSKRPPTSQIHPSPVHRRNTDPLEITAEDPSSSHSSSPTPTKRPAIPTPISTPHSISGSDFPVETDTNGPRASSSSWAPRKARQSSVSPTPDRPMNIEKERKADCLLNALRDVDISPRKLKSANQVNAIAGRETEVSTLSMEWEVGLGRAVTSDQPMPSVQDGTPAEASVDDIHMPSPELTHDEKESIVKNSDSGDLASTVQETEVNSLPTPISLDDASMIDERRGESRAIPAASNNESAIPLTMFGEPALPDDEIVMSNPFGLIQPQMRHRRNQYTDWSSRVGPGTALDLLPELDKYYDGGRWRWEMLWVEESRVTGMNHIPEKRLFVMVAWNRWKYEKGPISLAYPNLVPYLIGWLDKYWPVLRQADVEKETRGHFSRMYNLSVITAPQAIEALNHLDKLAKADRRAKGELTEDDLWEEEQERVSLRV